MAAVDAGYDGPLNVVGAGAVTAWQAARMGGRVPVPVLGPGWSSPRSAAEVLGAPLPDHVRELLVRGRGADGGRIGEVLGYQPARPTVDVVRELYDWASVDYVAPLRPAPSTAEGAA